MLKKLLIPLAISSAFLLSGCLKVEDNDNTQQIIDEINKTNKTTESSVTLTGTVSEYLSGEVINGLLMRYHIAGKWSEAQKLTSNQFEIKELNPNSDLIIEFKDESGKFLTRGFYLKTSGAASGQVALQSLGKLKLIQGEEKTFSILEDGSNNPLENIDVSYTISAYLNDTYSDLEQHLERATFDAQTGLYSLMLPKALNAEVKFKFDIDFDGKNDYFFIETHRSTLNSSDLALQDVIYVKPNGLVQSFGVELQLINPFGEVIPDLTLFTSYENSPNQAVTYSPETQSYTFEYKGNNQLTVSVPSFKFNDVTFNSASVLIKPNPEGVSVSYSGLINNNHTTLELINDTLKIAVMPKEESNGSYYGNGIVSKRLNNIDSSYNVFFKKPVSLSENSVLLEKLNQLKITKGNDSETDNVPAGVTVLERESTPVELETSLTYNDTFLKASASKALSPGFYRYRLSNIVDKESGLAVNIYDSAEQQFEINQTVSQEFNINELVLDNNNKMNAGKLIVAKNTAGVEASFQNQYNHSTLFIPKSMETLDYLNLTLFETVKRGSINQHFEVLTIVDGTSIGRSKVFATSLAGNEVIRDKSGYNNVFYTVLADGLWYQKAEYYFPDDDHMADSENSARFYYEYRIKGQAEVKKGTLQLFVQ